ncbi:hypothetical protein J5J83_14015 [Azoarcus sp. L1K30]|uniref:hypothetical protein n=1 Tax=Azoarcus sp. L1K30 TaxID=2820277 RepID=UPI001B81F963|nr:hypothetical protein [Azoarcus sp. L1K30]MBR0567235.1 hypothetical protein [Azoarcus sp. L1K30]
MSSIWRRVRAEWQDLVELVLVPGLAAVLPWWLCFRIFHRLSGWRFLYRASCEVAVAQAAARGWCSDPLGFERARRLLTIIDHADLYLARTRSDAWMRRHLEIAGEWPAARQPGLLFTFHWGAGMWGLRHAAASGLTPNALVAPLNAAQFDGRALCHRYSQARNGTVARALRRPPLDASASLRPALKALRAGEQVLAVVDVPADHASASEEITFLGMKARVPRPLFRLAVEQALPVTIYLTGVCRETGKRTLSIHQLGVSNDIHALIRDTFAVLEAAVRDDPAAWHFWGVAERFFS